MIKKHNNNPLNLKDGDIYLDPTDGKTYVILNGNKVELKELTNTQVDVSPYIQSSARVQTVYKDPASLHTTLTYTDGTKEAYSDLSFPEIRNVQVRMTKEQVATILNAETLSGHIINGDFVGTGVSKASATAQAEDEMMARLAAAARVRQMADKTSSSAASAGASQAVGAQSPYARTGDGLGKAMANSVYSANSEDWLSKRWADAGGNSWGVKISNIPWANLGAANRNDEKIICSDLPDLKLKPYEGYDPSNATVQVYYQDRYPSKHINVLIDDAIKALKKYKDMNVKIISKNLFQDGWNVAYSIIKKYGPDVGEEILMEVILPERVFDRTIHTIDNYAGLRGKWDTDTYITLRIAYLFGQAAKLNTNDANGYSSDILKIVNKIIRPYFTF